MKYSDVMTLFAYLAVALADQSVDVSWDSLLLWLSCCTCVES